jgi:hypothetical protein
MAEQDYPDDYDAHDGMTTSDLFTGEELREMEQADEARLDALDEARDAEAAAAQAWTGDDHDEH